MTREPEIDRALRERLTNLDKALPLLERHRDNLQRDLERERRELAERVGALEAQLAGAKRKLLAYTKERELVFRQLSGEAA